MIHLKEACFDLQGSSTLWLLFLALFDRYVVPLSKAQQETFAAKVREMAKDRGWSPFRGALACAGGAGGSGSDILAYRFTREGGK